MQDLPIFSRLSGLPARKRDFHVRVRLTIFRGGSERLKMPILTELRLQIGELTIWTGKPEFR